MGFVVFLNFESQLKKGRFFLGDVVFCKIWKQIKNKKKFCMGNL